MCLWHLPSLRCLVPCAFHPCITGLQNRLLVLVVCRSLTHWDSDVQPAASLNAIAEGGVEFGRTFANKDQNSDVLYDITGGNIYVLVSDNKKVQVFDSRKPPTAINDSGALGYTFEYEFGTRKVRQR